jgi:hypothetical protein
VRLLLQDLRLLRKMARRRRVSPLVLVSQLVREEASRTKVRDDRESADKRMPGAARRS